MIPLGQPLSLEQQQIADRPVGAHQLVLGVAGAGKTRVLVERVRHLTTIDGLTPGQELLALSFSRAAASAWRTASVADVDNQPMLTFDSFASRLLSRAVDQSDAPRSFDERIRSATRKIREDAGIQAAVRPVRHICVDEVQDLVGPRLLFVQALLDLPWVEGFTLLGDPAQAIYDFEDTSSRDVSAFDSFRRWLQNQFPDLQIAVLENSWRITSSRAGPLLDCGRRLASSDGDQRSVRKSLDRLLLDARSVADLPAGATTISGLPTPVVVLCRNNGQAIAISGALYARGVTHVLRWASGTGPVPTWVAIAVRAVRTTRIQKEAFIAAYERSGGVMPPQSAWRVLKQLDGASGDVELARVRRTIQRGPIPESVSADAEDRIVVSTVHRAKGLEFTTVVLVKPERSEEVMETRVIYVAMTRARAQVYLIPPPRVNLRLDHASGHRWTTVAYPGQRATAVEVRPEDADHAVPPGGRAASDIQNYLLDEVHPGDPLEVRLREDGRYAITHDGMAVGELTETFSTDLGCATQSTRRMTALPPAIEGLCVESVVTVAGDPSEGETAGLGRTGLWLGLRVHGLGRLGS